MKSLVPTVLVLSAVGFSAATPHDALTPTVVRADVAPDETLLYAVVRGTTLALELPPGADELWIDVVAEVAVERPYRADRRTEFGIRVRAPGGYDRTIHLDSRVSLERPESPARGRRATVLVAVGADVEGTDVRTLRLPLPPEATRGGVVHITTEPSRARRVLVRAFARGPRTTEAEAYTHIRPDSDAPNAGPRSGLDARDLPAAHRERANGRRELRLATTRASAANTVRAVLTTYRRAFDGTHDAERLGARTSEVRTSCVNVEGPVQLTFDAPPGARLAVSDGLTGFDSGTDERSHVVPPAGRLTLALRRSDARSVAFHAVDADVPVRVFLAGSDGPVLGERAHHAESQGGVTELMPDERRVRMLALASDEPLRFPLVGTEGRVRVEVRCAAADEVTDSMRAAVAVAVERADGLTEVHDVDALRPASRFEHFTSGARSTETLELSVTVPTGARSVQLLGTPTCAARVSVRDPRVSTSRLTAAYLRHDLVEARFHYAPLDRRTWVGIEATSPSAESRKARVRELVEIVRIVPIGAARDVERRALGRGRIIRRPRRTARALTADGNPLSQRVLLRRPRIEQASGDGFVELRGRTRISFDPARPTPTVLVRVAADDIGRVVDVVVDGVRRDRVALTATGVRMDLPLAPGDHDVEILGLGAASRAFVSAGSRRVPTVRRLRFESLGPGERLRYTFDASSGERQTVRVQLVTVDGAASFPLILTRHGGDGAAQGGFTARHVGTVRPDSDLWLLDLHTDAPLGTGAVAMRWPRQTGETRRTFEVARPIGDGTPLYVRVVLVEETGVEVHAQASLRSLEGFE